MECPSKLQRRILQKLSISHVLWREKKESYKSRNFCSSALRYRSCCRFYVICPSALLKGEPKKVATLSKTVFVQLFLPFLLQTIFPLAGKILSRKADRDWKKGSWNELASESAKVTSLSNESLGTGSRSWARRPTSTSLAVFFQQMKKECEDFVLEGGLSRARLRFASLMPWKVENIFAHFLKRCNLTIRERGNIPNERGALDFWSKELQLAGTVLKTSFEA